MKNCVLLPFDQLGMKYIFTTPNMMVASVDHQDHFLQGQWWAIY